MKNINLSSLAVKKITPTVPDISALIKHVTDYLVVVQVEGTKRAEISARMNETICAIQAQRDILIHSIDRTFQERSLIIQGQLNALEKAVETGNLELANLSLQGMAHVIQTSPFKNISDLREKMQSKDFVLRLD